MPRPAPAAASPRDGAPTARASSRWFPPMAAPPPVAQRDLKPEDVAPESPAVDSTAARIAELERELEEAREEIADLLAGGREITAAAETRVDEMRAALDKHVLECVDLARQRDAALAEVTTLRAKEPPHDWSLVSANRDELRALIVALAKGLGPVYWPDASSPRRWESAVSRYVSDHAVGVLDVPVDVMRALHAHGGAQ